MIWNTPEGKTGFMHEAAKRLAVFDEEIERSNYIEAVAKAYRVNVDELKEAGGADGSTDRTCKACGEAENHEKAVTKRRTTVF